VLEIAKSAGFNSPPWNLAILINHIRCLKPDERIEPLIKADPLYATGLKSPFRSSCPFVSQRLIQTLNPEPLNGKLNRHLLYFSTRIVSLMNRIKCHGDLAGITNDLTRNAFLTD
jgi:hypothetical protein